MNNLFNKTFYRFTLGFVGILLLSFAVAAVVSKLDAAGQIPASVEGGR